MASKEEKLAAARRKLKEFQGKHKEGEVLKHKIDAKVSKQYFHTNNSPTPNSENENAKESLLSTPSRQPVVRKTAEDFINERKISDSSSNGGDFPRFRAEYHSPNENSLDNIQGEQNSDCTNGLKPDCGEIHGKNFEIGSFTNSISRDMIVFEKNHENNISPCDSTKPKPAEGKEYFNNDVNSKNCFSDVIKPLQMELQNHAQTITILVQQRNDAQTALAEIQTQLDAKSGEAKELKQQITRLTSSASNLNQRLSDAEDVIMKLKLEKEDNLQKQDELRMLADKIQAELAAKEEEFQELKKKYDEKNHSCQKLLFSLHEAQRQLSFYQIQLQQYSAEGHSGLAVQVSELQNENLSLKQKLGELEKKLEAETAEKEESSQKFHIYAQQCNSQLSSLNSQLKSLKLENENLIQKNNVLTKNLSELESAEGRESSESFKKEIADLHSQMSALSENNNHVLSDLKKKEEECTRLKNELGVKDSEINKLLEELEELKEENKKLSNDAEIPKANERLLATLESDKIAAAKAVSQNVKLKEQVVELESAFIKLSEEKLELTNQLAHEKHVTAELQNLIKKSEHTHHHDGHHECHHGDEKPESLVNDSDEIEELRNIVRQLQDDKMELTTRLNSYEGSKTGSNEEEEKKKSGMGCDHEHEESQCENTKVLLQQMEEKVKKTMNEIAVLDEEKEKLEHLVLQLQGETETIGEYITLYQKQRMILKQRAQEKDVQLLQLSKDKEELKSKLASLDELVQRLIAERGNASVQTGSKSPVTSSLTSSENTAGKILALINEIGSTTLIDNQSIVFEHCSCCSGRLITI